jgi:hypothetical protein
MPDQRSPNSVGGPRIPDTRDAFFEAGYETREYLEVVVGVTLKTLSNYVNHAADTPLDAAFQSAKLAA